MGDEDVFDLAEEGKHDGEAAVEAALEAVIRGKENKQFTHEFLMELCTNVNHVQRKYSTRFVYVKEHHHYGKMGAE